MKTTGNNLIERDHCLLGKRSKQELFFFGLFVFNVVVLSREDFFQLNSHFLDSFFTELPYLLMMT